MEKLSEHGCYGGRVAYFKHQSDTLDCEMRFSVFTPPTSEAKKQPVVTYLAD